MGVRTNKNIFLGALSALTVALAAPGLAEDTAAIRRRQELNTLTRLLHTAKDFRVRVQVALGLPKFGEDALVALHVALGDKHPAVRQVAANAIDTISQAKNHARRTPLTLEDATVRYVVALGDMDNQSGLWGETMKQVLKKLIHDELGRTKGVAVASPSTSEQHRLPHMRVMGNLVRVVRDRSHRDLRIQCEVSLTLIDERHNTLKGLLKGVATSVQPQHIPAGLHDERKIMLHALYAAVRSAVSRVPAAIDNMNQATL